MKILICQIKVFPACCSCCCCSCCTCCVVRIECLSVCSCIYSWEERNCWGKIGIVETRYYHSHVFEGSSLGDLGESWRQEVGKIASAISPYRPGEAKSVIRITFLRVPAEQLFDRAT